MECLSSNIKTVSANLVIFNYENPHFKKTEYTVIFCNMIGTWLEAGILYHYQYIRDLKTQHYSDIFNFMSLGADLQKSDVM